MYVLDKLWRGTLSPSEEYLNAGSEYDALRKDLLKKEKRITEELSDYGQQLFHEYQEIRAQMTAISEEEAFVTGFRMGVGIILDSIL